MIKDGGCVRISVRDDGIGIDPRILPTLFNDYREIWNSTSDADSRRGMGIGLSVCRAIIDAHDGNIRAYNKTGGGACLEFELPVQKEEAK